MLGTGLGGTGQGAGRERPGYTAQHRDHHFGRLGWERQSKLLGSTRCMQYICPGCAGAASTPSPGSASQKSLTCSPSPPRFNTPPLHPWLVCTAQNVLGIISVCTFASVCAGCILKAIKSSSVCLRGTCIFPSAGRTPAPSTPRLVPCITPWLGCDPPGGGAEASSSLGTSPVWLVATCPRVPQAKLLGPGSARRLTEVHADGSGHAGPPAGARRCPPPRDNASG